MTVILATDFMAVLVVAVIVVDVVFVAMDSISSITKRIRNECPRRLRRTLFLLLV